jgi:hypothetical protein
MQPIFSLSHERSQHPLSFAGFQGAVPFSSIGLRLLLIIFLCLPGLGGCSSTYYSAMEKMGVHKRDIMIDRVGAARDAQHEAKEQFQSALEEFTSIVSVKDSDLEKHYRILNAQYTASKDKADAVRKRIASVEAVSGALFDEWEKELQQYSSEALRRDSARKLKETKEQYRQLINAMKRAEAKIQPVLAVFSDQVLYLKHNLNARAIAALKGELVDLEGNVGQLVREMEASIKEADQFISGLRNP